MDKAESIFDAILPRETLDELKDMITTKRGGRRPSDLDAHLVSIFCGCIENTDRDPLGSLLFLGRMAQSLDDAGRLTEFRARILPALATMGRAAQIEILTSGEL